LWPALAWRRGGAPSRAVSLGAASGLLALLSWFGLDFLTGAPRIGLSERVLAAVLLGIRSLDADCSKQDPDNDSLHPDCSPGGRKGR
ncbi:MAG: hypothetical protein ACRDRV_04240, partial [Pseudonocardiaceae bacterium]